MASGTAVRPSRLVRVLLPGLLLAPVLIAGLGCQSSTRTANPARAFLQPQCDVRGTVAGPDGHPVAGAVVTAYDARPAYLFGADELHPLGRQTTGPDGAFHFRVSREVGRIYFIARKQGLATGWSCCSDPQEQEPVVVPMAPPADLVGRVLDHQRKPVPGAAVTVCVGQRYQPLTDLGRAASCLAARTDAEGRFRLQDLPADQAVHLSIAAAGHGRLDTNRLQEDGYWPGQAAMDLQMPESAAIEATVVVKDTGKPAGNVALLLWTRSLAREIEGTPVPGSPGRFRWTDVPPGSGMIFVAAPFNGLPAWAGSRTPVEVKPGQPAQVKIEVSRGQIVEIHARDARTGQPIKDYVAGMSSPEARCSGVGRGGPDGIARLRVVPGTFPYVWAEPHRYRQYRASEPVKVEPGKPLVIDVTLEPSPRYRGTVLDSDGNPVAGASVAILGEVADGAISDAKGRFTLYPPFYETDQIPSVTLVARQLTANLAAAVEVPSPDSPAEIRLQAGASREVAVIDPDGKPIAGAHVTFTLGHCDARPQGGRFQAYTGADGLCTLRAFPADKPLTLCVQAGGYVAQALPLEAAPATRVPQRIRLQLQPTRRLAEGPLVKTIAIPATPHEEAIWGATGRDSRGHIWFAVSKANKPGASADLFEFVPDTGEVIARGNVIDELKKANLLEPDQQQMKIHSKIYEVDGYLYFVSMDEKGEDEQKRAQPVFGSHLWRLRLADNAWEHLLAIPEAMVGLAVGGGKVYCIGYWDHALCQYDIATKASKTIKVGSCFGHVSRNVIADARGHVYLPRCTRTAGMLQAELVEYDDQLREVASTKFPQYYNGSANWAYGITALQPLPDGSIAILTHNGWLTRICPQETGPARLEQMGWFHPDGPQMADCLFLDRTGRYLMGPAQNASRLSDWVTYDLQTGRRTTAPLSDTQAGDPSWGRYMLYGSLTQDDQGRCYVAGQTGKASGEGWRPLLLQVDPNAARADTAAAGK